MNLGGTTQSKSRFAFERAPSPSRRAESLSRQHRRPAVRPSNAVVESLVPGQPLPRCGSTSTIPEMALHGDISGLRALVVLDGLHSVRPNCSLEQQRGRGFGLGTGGSMFDSRRLRSPATLPRAAQLECYAAVDRAPHSVTFAE